MLNFLNSKVFSLTFLFLMMSPLPFWKIYELYSVHNTKILFNKFSKNRPVFCYDTTNGVIDYVMVAEDTVNAKLICEYYKEKMSSEFSLGIDFPINFAPYDKVFYLISDFKKSGYSQIIAFDTTCWGHWEIYAPNLSLKNSPPTKKQIADKDKYWQARELDIEYNRTKMNTSHTNQSVYGCQCN